jgi:hypothetical protein
VKTEERNSIRKFWKKIGGRKIARENFGKRENM